MDINYNKENISIVEIDKVRPNSWNPKDKDTEDFRRVKLSIEKNGLRAPVVVRENKGFEIVDGEQRWRSCKDLGYKNVLIYNEGKMSDQKAKELTIWYQQQVPFNEVDLAFLVNDLAKLENAILPFKDEEIDEYIKMAEFDWDSFKNEDPGENPADNILTFSITVTKEQKEIIDSAMAKCKQIAESDISEGRTLELISIEFINMPEGTVGG